MTTCTCKCKMIKRYWLVKMLTEKLQAQIRDICTELRGEQIKMFTVKMMVVAVVLKVRLLMEHGQCIKRKQFSYSSVYLTDW